MGDINRTYTIRDFIIHPWLFELYDEIELSLKKVFESGGFDSANGPHFDAQVESKGTRAQHDLNGQYSLNMESIRNMIAWRDRDVERLEHDRDRRLEEIEKAKQDYAFYKQKYDNLLSSKKPKKEVQTHGKSYQRPIVQGQSA